MIRRVLSAWPLAGIGAGVAVGVNTPPLSGGTILGVAMVAAFGLVWVRRAARGG